VNDSRSGAASAGAAGSERRAADSKRAVARREPAAAEAPALDSLLRCLVRISYEFGKPITEGEIRAAVPLDASGMSVEQFCRAAQRLNYQVRRVRKVSSRTLADMPAPFVLLGRRGAPARLALGHRDGALALFDGGTGEVIELPYQSAAAVIDEAILVKPQGSAAKLSWQTLASRRVRGVLRELLLASLVINILALGLPLFSMTVFNKVVGQQALDTLTVLVIGMVVVLSFEAVLRVIRGYVAAHTGARLDALIGSEVMHHFLALPYARFEQSSTGVMGERIRQLDTVRAFFTSQLPMQVVDVGFTLVFLAVMFFIHPAMAFLTLGIAPFMIGVAVLLHWRQMKLIKQIFEAQAAKAQALNESINNALTVKSLALEPEMERRWESRLATAAFASYRAGHLANVSGTLGYLLQMLASLAILSIGSVLAIQGEMTVGALIACNMLASRVLVPLRAIATGWHQVQETKEAFRRINEVMDEPAESPPGTASPTPELKGRIQLEAVDFSFEPGQASTLRSIDLSIERGSVIGIIGPSGSGKSTLAKMMQGLYRPTGGRVTIDGTDVQHMSLQALRQQIGVVPQDNQLFAGTVRENIQLGALARDPDRVVAVAKFVGAHDFIQRLPKGYETVLGERGVGLSNGQRQLLCIARALVRNPRVLILDEATSDLDPVAEDFLLRNLQRAAKGRTIVIVTHRLAPLAIADRVALLIDGRIERVGPPAEVIAFAKTRMAEVAMPR
jgi:ATP-binding cassette, subfamily B, bacterial HlyB/CyaB